jgi:hypothetical protein
MWQALVSGWKFLAVGVALGALLTGWGAWKLHSNRMDAKEAACVARVLAAVDDTTTQLQAQCIADKRITSEASNEYQTDLSVARAELAKLKRVRGKTCVVTSATCAPLGSHASSGVGTHERYGVDSDTLRDFAFQCEAMRIQLHSLQEFNKIVWHSRGQL